MTALAVELAADPPALRVVGDGRRSTNKVLAAQRRTRAVELVASGLTYQQVADELGYKNRGTVHRLVQQSLQSHEASKVEEYRALEVRRLDALQTALWDRAMAGDVNAVEQCRRIIEARCRTLGLTGTAKRKRSKCRQPQTVVLQENDCRTRGRLDHS